MSAAGSDSGSAVPRLGIVVAGRGSLTPVEAYGALRADYQPVFLIHPSQDGSGESARLDAALTALARRAEVRVLPDDGLPTALDGITTFCADGVPVVQRLADELGLPALAAGDGRSLHDKAAQRLALGPELSPRFVALPQPCCAGVPGGHAGCTGPEWAAALDQLGLPAVLKPAHGQASRGVRRIDSGADLAAARAEIAADRAGARGEIAAARAETTAARAENTADPAPKAAGPPWLLEEYLVGRDGWPRAAYLSVESVVRDSEIRHVALTRKLPMVEPFRELGQYLLPANGDPEQDAELLAAASEALRRLRVADAVTHTELMVTAAGPKVIEVNARLGGLVRELVAAGRGLDLARAAAAVATGRPVAAAEQPDGGLVFQYAPLAPVQPARFRQAHGLDAVGSLAGVAKYLPHVTAGQLLAGGTETVTMGVVSGRCRDEDELAALVAEVERLLTYEFLLCPEKDQSVRCDARGRIR